MIKLETSFSCIVDRYSDSLTKLAGKSSLHFSAPSAPSAPSASLRLNSTFISLTAANPRDVAGVFFEGSHDCCFTAEAGLLNALEGLLHAFVVLRHNFDEFRNYGVPVGENLRGASAFGVSLVTLEHHPDLLDVVG